MGFRASSGHKSKKGIQKANARRPQSSQVLRLTGVCALCRIFPGSHLGSSSAGEEITWSSKRPLVLAGLQLQAQLVCDPQTGWSRALQTGPAADRQPSSPRLKPLSPSWPAQLRGPLCLGGFPSAPSTVCIFPPGQEEESEEQPSGWDAGSRSAEAERRQRRRGAEPSPSPTFRPLANPFVQGWRPGF